MTGCFCGSAAAMLFAASGFAPEIEAGGGMDSGGSLAIQFFVAQVVAYICGVFQTEIVNLLKHDTPVLVCFLVTYLTYFGLDGLNKIVLPRLIGLETIVWGDWYFLPIGFSLFVGLVVGSLMERQTLIKILAEGPPQSRAATPFSPRSSESEALAIKDDEEEPEDKRSPLRLGAKMVHLQPVNIPEGRTMAPRDLTSLPSLGQVEEEHPLAVVDDSAAGRDLALAIVGETLDKRWEGDKLMLRTITYANPEEYDQADQARQCLETAIATRRKIPELSHRTAAYSLQRNAQEGRGLTVALQTAAEKKEHPDEIPKLEMAVVRELNVSRYANWKPADTVVSANMPEPGTMGPPPEPPPKKSFAKTIERNVEWAPVETVKRKVDRSVKRRDPEELAAEKTLHDAFD
jgi:hypothetical protein